MNQYENKPQGGKKKPGKFAGFLKSNLLFMFCGAGLAFALWLVIGFA